MVASFLFKAFFLALSISLEVSDDAGESDDDEVGESDNNGELLFFCWKKVGHQYSFVKTSLVPDSPLARWSGILQVRHLYRGAVSPPGFLHPSPSPQIPRGYKSGPFFHTGSSESVLLLLLLSALRL